jgi:hypothetical protein
MFTSFATLAIVAAALAVLAVLPGPAAAEAEGAEVLNFGCVVSAAPDTNSPSDGESGPRIWVINDEQAVIFSPASWPAHFEGSSACNIKLYHP